MAAVLGLATDALFWIGWAFLLPQLAVLVVNLMAFPVLGRVAASPLPLRKVSILVPARNEAHNLPTTLPGILSQGADEVIVLDDGSEDDTASVLAAWSDGHPELRRLTGAPLPPGWTGKNWACHQLAQVATGDLWLFTDADVHWGPGALASVRQLQHATGAGLTTVWPRQITGSWFERIAVPIVDVVLLAGLPHPLATRSTLAAAAAANGQCMMFAREAYAQSGGHASVRANVLDDVRLAQRAKHAGVRLALGLGGDRLAVRMYRGSREVVDGFAKNILAAVGGRPGVLVGLTILNTLVYTAAWPLAWLDPRWLVLGSAGLALRAATAWKTGRPVAEAMLQILLPVALWPIVAQAIRWRRGYRWKGRTYP